MMLTSRSNERCINQLTVNLATMNSSTRSESDWQGLVSEVSVKHGRSAGCRVDMEHMEQDTRSNQLFICSNFPYGYTIHLTLCIKQG